MVRRVRAQALMLLLGGASGACGFAALGLALYATGQPLAAATVFGAFGFAVGALCVLLTPLQQRLPAQRQADLPGDALAGMVRATLAQAAAELGNRSGSAADRRPAEAPLALAGSPATAPAPVPVPVPSGTGRQFASSAFGA